MWLCFSAFFGGVASRIQRILAAENLLIEVTACIKAKEDEGSLRNRQQHLRLDGGEVQPATRNGDHDDRRDDTRGNGPQALAEVGGDKGERSGEENLEQQITAEDLLPDTKDHRNKGENEMKEEGQENIDDGIDRDGTKGGSYDPCGGKDGSAEDGDFNYDCYINENDGDLLAQVCVDFPGLPLCQHTETRRCFTIDLFLSPSRRYMLLSGE